MTVHFFPIPFILADPNPTSSWSLSDQWRGWGAAVAWSLPGLAALIWFLPVFFDGRARRHLAARVGIVLGYGAIVAGIVYLYQPAKLSEPLVEIVTTPREQWACGVTRSGSVFCLGGNADGQLGPSNERNIERPSRVDELSPSTVLFMGQHATCGLAPPSTVRCVGRWRAEAGRSFSATSSLEVTDTLVGDDELVFVSRTGALEVWSGGEPKSIVGASSQATLCCSLVALRRGERAEARDLSTGRAMDLGPARDIACEVQDQACRVAVLDGKRLRYFSPIGVQEEELAISDTARFAPSEGDIVLRDGHRRARCAAGVGWLQKVAVGCNWEESARKPLLLRGTPEELADPRLTYAAQELAAMTLRLR